MGLDLNIIPIADVATDGISFIFNDLSSSPLTSEELALMDGLTIAYPLEQNGPDYQNFVSLWTAAGNLEKDIFPYSMFNLACLQSMVYGWDKVRLVH